MDKEKKQEIKAKDKKPFISNEAKLKAYKSSIEDNPWYRVYEYLFRGLPSGGEGIKRVVD